MTAKSPVYDVENHKVVSADDWTTARKELLAKEKAFTRLRDELSQARRDLPWEQVEKQYVFDGPSGRLALADLFGGSSQLVVYHFMYDPSWEAGCPSCSFWADSFNALPVHLRARDVSFAAISRAPLAQIEAYKKRMGWSFPWFSSFPSEFNRDFGVTFTPEEIEKDRGYYNYVERSPPDTEGPGISVFHKDPSGRVFHTYSAFGRGIDLMNAAYNYLDLVPKGRDEGGQPPYWLRRHDEY
jgi:predicted dithiol-disulfide oxidoreductase (DUF899 family)